jgi:hypothetical protein
MASMAALRAGLALALAALALPSAALAGVEPLADVAPTGTHFAEVVNPPGATATARAAQEAGFRPYPTTNGGSVAVAISERYGDQVQGDQARSYVDFLDSLEHGSELSLLRVYIAPRDEVLEKCGGQDGTLACYDGSTRIMVVPGEQVQLPSGVTTSYIVAHEYGHHIAAMRSNAPFSAFRMGPKYWSSYHRVCDLTSNGLLAPGNEAELYLSNPGEAWAETYAQLKYQGIPWQYTTLLQPDAGAFEAARRDIATPWTAQERRVFRGTFGRRGSSTRRFRFDLTLDGSLSLRLTGPRASNYDLAVSSDGREVGRSSSGGSRDRLSWQAACRERAMERVTVTVKRVRGRGAFSLRLSYAG